MANEVTPAESKLMDRINPNEMRRMNMGATTLQIKDMSQLMDFARVMAVGGVAIPKHLRGNPGACIMICMQAMEWEMSPFSLANKSYSVNDRVAYEAQAINAVVIRRAPIKGRPQYEFTGQGESRRCKVTVVDTNGDVLDYESPPISQIPVKNSPLWKGDPDQQLAYYSVRAMARRHFPDIIMGVIEREEAKYGAIEPDEDPGRGAAPQQSLPKRGYEQKLDALANDDFQQAPAAAQEGEPDLEGMGVAPDPAPAPDVPPEALMAAAGKGSRSLKLALGKLSQDEIDAIPQNHRDMLKRAAQMSDRNSGADPE